MAPVTRLGVDVGGTFTDLVWVSADQIVTAKVLSTAEPEIGVFEALARLGLHQVRAVDLFSHGMTVATNALLERQGVPTALLTTAGFRDLLEIARQNRPALYDLCQPKPVPVVAREYCLGVRERCSRGGVIEPLTEAEIARVIDQVRPWVEQQQIQAIAVGLLFSFLYPEHEQRLGQGLQQAFPQIHVSLSSEVAPEFREYERFCTTAIDAYLSPKLAGYLERLAQGCQQRDLPLPLIMQSSGGVTTVEQAAAHASVALLSGPAGGAYGAAYLGRISGYGDLLTFDMGGTSTDVALIRAGQPQLTPQAQICGLPVQQPQIDIHTVSAGGGSIAAWVPGGGLQVGPRSAGSRPGPACYGLGGQAPTVTDANLWLGYLPDGGLLADVVQLSRQQAAAAIQSLSASLDLSVAETAVGIRKLANVHMARALRVISVERGLDPSRFALMAFGGAGPMHACALASELGITTILLPAACGVLSALGMAVADLRRDYRRAVLEDLSALKGWEPVFQVLIAQAQADLQQPLLEFSLDLRYRGQSFEIAIPLQLQDSVAQVRQRFDQAHLGLYGWQEPQREIEVIHARLSGTQVLPRVQLPRPQGSKAQVIGERQVWVGSGFESVAIWDRDSMAVGTQIQGPAIVAMREATAVIDPGWLGEVNQQGTIRLTFAS